MVAPGKKPMLNIGSGYEPKTGWINADVSEAGGLVDLKADIRRLPFANAVFSQVLAESIVEHLDDPRVGLAELARVLEKEGQVEVRVPALGSHAAHLDPTHRYLADLKHWQELMFETFEQVKISSVGVRWRQSLSLVLTQRILIKVLGWHDLAQCWILRASRPRTVRLNLIAPRWWLDQGTNSARADATSSANRTT